MSTLFVQKATDDSHIIVQSDNLDELLKTGVVAVVRLEDFEAWTSKENVKPDVLILREEKKDVAVSLQFFWVLVARTRGVKLVVIESAEPAEPNRVEMPMFNMTVMWTTTVILTDCPLPKHDPTPEWQFDFYRTDYDLTVPVGFSSKVMDRFNDWCNNNDFIATESLTFYITDPKDFPVEYMEMLVSWANGEGCSAGMPCLKRLNLIGRISQEVADFDDGLFNKTNVFIRGPKPLDGTYSYETNDDPLCDKCEIKII